MPEESDLPPSKGLKERIQHARKKAAGEKEEKPLGAFQVSTELLAGVLVGAFVGFYLDKWLATKPIFFLICFFLGAFAGGYNIYKSVQQDSNDTEHNNDK